MRQPIHVVRRGAANSLSKSAIALFVGGCGFGLMYLGLTVVALIAGGASPG